ncbi:hypothetical protein [Kitasatospora sp. NPDC050463]|uniref:hypothetical protein n=1 Tax=Kitasatospora sp. NPDC050463 TaxID=3155786 RepID=UPI0033C544AF
MSDAVPQHGFTAARRGYAPEQVDRALTALTAQRDEAWERLSVLGAGIREMERRLADIRQAAADAPDPDYQVLSEQAAGLATMAANEAKAVREAAERFAEDLRDEVYEAGQARGQAAKEYAATTRAEADQAARRTDERTRAEAEAIRADADRETRALRDAATAHAAKVRVAAAEASELAEAKLAELRREADETLAAAAAKADAEDAEMSATAERRLKEAEQYRDTVLGQIKQSDAEAQARADQLIEQARREAEAINAASEREQREFAVRQETVQKHLDHIKGTLASLTGAAVGAIEPAEAAGATEGPDDGAPAVDSEADTGEIAVASLRKAVAVGGGQAVGADTATAVLPVTAGPVTSGPVGSEAGPFDATPTDAAPADSVEAAPVAPVAPGAPAAAPAAVEAVTTGPVSPGPVPPRPATPPSGSTATGAAAAAQGRAGDDETRIIPKIVIVDDGSDYATPNTVGLNRRR